VRRRGSCLIDGSTCCPQLNPSRLDNLITPYFYEKAPIHHKVCERHASCRHCIPCAVDQAVVCSICRSRLSSSICSFESFNVRPPNQSVLVSVRRFYDIQMISGCTALTSAPGCLDPRPLIMPHSSIVWLRTSSCGDG